MHRGEEVDEVLDIYEALEALPTTPDFPLLLVKMPKMVAKKKTEQGIHKLSKVASTLQKRKTAKNNPFILNDIVFIRFVLEQLENFQSKKIEVPCLLRRFQYY